MALSVNLFTWEEGNDEYCVNAPHHEAYVSQLLSPLCEKTVLLEIDLGSGTDDEIAESIKAALPQWRSVKGVEVNETGIVRFGYGTIKKIINYRLVAMLDILLWAKRKELRISDDRLSRLLYTDEDEETTTRLGYHIKDSDRPLAMKAATIDFIRQFNFFMNRNPHLKNMRVSDVMKLSDSNDLEFPKSTTAGQTVTLQLGSSLLSFPNCSYSDPITTTKGKQNEQSKYPPNSLARSYEQNRLWQGLDLSSNQRRFISTTNKNWFACNCICRKRS